MKVLHHARELQPAGRPVHAALGMFDGVHLGHHAIISRTVAAARATGGLSLVITFDCHPSAVVAPDRVPPLIQNLHERLASIRAVGAEALLLLHFDAAFSQQSGEVFARRLATDLGSLRSLCVGADFVFGHKRSGTVELLRRLGAELGFAVHPLAAVTLDGEIVSSTRIRESVRSGDFEAAGRMLGRPYELAGRVIHGDQRGRQLGFPTANLAVAGLVLPPNGVYATEAAVGDPWRHSVTNIGLRPTLNLATPRLQVETHLLDFEGDLYGQDLRLRFRRRLRAERAFGSIGELQAQIRQDAAAARLVFADGKV